MEKKLPSWVFKAPWQRIHDAAERHKLPPELIAAVIQLESGGNTYAVRYEPLYRWTHMIASLANVAGCTYATMEQMQKTSYGLMQVMGGVYYEHRKISDGYWATAMIDPDIGLDFGCRHLKQKFVQYGPDPANTYAAYNAGSVRFTPGGHFQNQRAVDIFMGYYRQLCDI